MVVIDEASASLDLDSDSVMNAAIARESVECTLLTIAHRTSAEHGAVERSYDGV